MAFPQPLPPPPPSPLPSILGSSISSQSPMRKQPLLPFNIVHKSKDEVFFEFPNLPRDSNAPFLKAIIRQYLSSPQLSSVSSQSLRMILGRLRCLNYTIEQYNQGVITSTPVFRKYWRPRTINLFSGFGFVIDSAIQTIELVGLTELIQSVEELYYENIQNARDLIKGSLITFDGLGELYLPEGPVQGKTALGGTTGIFMVVDSYYEEHRALVGTEKTFHWTMEFVATMGEHFSIVRFEEVLSGWMGLRARAISDLVYTPLCPAEHEAARKRGEKYIQYASGAAQFLAYKPYAFFRHVQKRENNATSMSRLGSSQLSASGRVMIDAARGIALGHHAFQGFDEPTSAMAKLSECYRHWRNSDKKSKTNDVLTLWNMVPFDLIIYCWPALVGFSFSAKVWGHVLVDGLAPIEFQADAFDQLVLAPERKQLIRALVRFGSSQATEDIVPGKGSGSVFLLHGPPGVGKTLTVEAMAEVLKRPLYYVTMGELGTTPETVEAHLTDVLSLCADWDALVLLDEADIFLEARSSSADLARNALVCVMLRLLEYHPGILFLTTNRVRTFDPAFESRVTVALRYYALNVNARAQIWGNLLRKIDNQSR